MLVILLQGLSHLTQGHWGDLLYSVSAEAIKDLFKYLLNEYTDI